MTLRVTVYVLHEDRRDEITFLRQREGEGEGELLFVAKYDENNKVFEYDFTNSDVGRNQEEEGINRYLQRQDSDHTFDSIVRALHTEIQN